MCEDNQELSPKQKIELDLVIKLIKGLDTINQPAFYALVKAIYAHSNLARRTAAETLKQAIHDFWND